MADQAAPPTGEQPQGDGSGGIGSTSPWNLDAHPEELRPFLAEELKKIEGGITPKLQEAAELRKQFGHLSEIEGFSDVPVEELQELLEFRQVVQDPAQFEEWWSAIGEELGFFQGDDDYETQDEQQPADDEPPAWAASLMERLDALEGTTRQSEQEMRTQQAMQKIDSDLGALREKHGDFDEDAVCSLALAYDNDPDAITKAFADYQRITGKAQSELVDGVESRPGSTPLSGGNADTTPQTVSWHNGQSPKDLARARMGVR